MLPRSMQPERNWSNSGLSACFRIESMGNTARSNVASGVIHGIDPILLRALMVEQPLPLFAGLEGAQRIGDELRPGLTGKATPHPTAPRWHPPAAQLQPKRPPLQPP